MRKQALWWQESLAATGGRSSVVLPESDNLNPCALNKSRRAGWSWKRERATQCHQRAAQSQSRVPAPHPHSSPNCQQCRNQLCNQTLRAYRCSSVCIIPLQIIILRSFTLHLTFQSALITCIISSPNCLQSRNQLSKETSVTRVHFEVRVIQAQIIACIFTLYLTFKRAFTYTISWHLLKNPMKAIRQTDTCSVPLYRWEHGGRRASHLPTILLANTGVCLPRPAHYLTCLSQRGWSYMMIAGES